MERFPGNSTVRRLGTSWQLVSVLTEISLLNNEHMLRMTICADLQLQKYLFVGLIIIRPFEARIRAWIRTMTNSLFLSSATDKFSPVHPRIWQWLNPTLLIVFETLSGTNRTAAKGLHYRSLLVESGYCHCSIDDWWNLKVMQQWFRPFFLNDSVITIRFLSLIVVRTHTNTYSKSKDVQ